MDRNTVIGLALIFVILISFWFINQPAINEIEKQKQAQDSTLAAQKADSAKKSLDVAAKPVVAEKDTVADSVMVAGKYGSFASFTEGKNKEVVLENDLMR